MWFQNRRQKLKKEESRAAAAMASTMATLVAPVAMEESGLRAELAPLGLSEWDAPRSCPSPSASSSGGTADLPLSEDVAETTTASAYLDSVKRALESSRDPTPPHANHPPAAPLHAGVVAAAPPLAVPPPHEPKDGQQRRLAAGQQPAAGQQHGGPGMGAVGLPFAGLPAPFARSLFNLHAMGIDVSLLTALLKTAPPLPSLPLSTAPIDAAPAVPAAPATPAAASAPPAPPGACSAAGGLAPSATIRLNQVRAGFTFDQLVGRPLFLTNARGAVGPPPAPAAAPQASAPPVGLPLPSVFPNGGPPASAFPASTLHASTLHASTLHASGHYGAHSLRGAGPPASRSSADRGWTPLANVETLGGVGDGGVGDTANAALADHLGLSLFGVLGGGKVGQGVLQGEFASAADNEVERILDGLKADQADLGALGDLGDPATSAAPFLFASSGGAGASNGHAGTGYAGYAGTGGAGTVGAKTQRYAASFAHWPAVAVGF